MQNFGAVTQLFVKYNSDGSVILIVTKAVDIIPASTQDIELKPWLSDSGAKYILGYLGF